MRGDYFDMIAPETDNDLPSQRKDNTIAWGGEEELSEMEKNSGHEGAGGGGWGSRG